jgi:two-component sensor histidine kinase
MQLDSELERYETQLEERTKLLKDLALDAQSDVERERQKLARELHDELGSILTATKMDVSWVIRRVKESAPEVSEKLSKTILYLDQGIQFKRDVVQRLHPSMIETFGFWPALSSLIDDVAARNRWEMDVILPEETTPLNEVVSLIIYRVIQETLNNATKYARATKVSLYMIIELGYLKLELQDNGVGLDMDTIVEGTTHGLKGMKNRVMAIGGHFELVSAPGQGMMTRVMIPLDTVRDATPDTARDIERDIARDATRDTTRDTARDEVRDEARDPTRDAKRDPTRDAKRDPTRDATRDPTRDASRDPTRDARRDPTRDASRDPTRDAKRDLPRDTARDASTAARSNSRAKDKKKSR